jgi:uncharacterized protein HemY
MPAVPRRVRLSGNKEVAMSVNTLMTVVVIVFVVAVLSLVVFALFELSPFAHHLERFHDPGRRQKSPRLD